MDNQNVIDKFIDRVVLFFNENEIVSSFIKKIYGMNSFKNVEVKGNALLYDSEKFSREISIDENKQEIILFESGSKYENSVTSYYKNKTFYKENADKYNVTKENIQTDFSRVGKSVIIDNTIFRSIDGYRENKRVFYSLSLFKRKYEKSTTEEKLIDASVCKKDFYLLANGDVLKIVNSNNKERYFYCDSSEISKDIKVDSNKAKFNVELNVKDAKIILESLDDAYKLINNDVIFDIRGRSY